MGGTRSEKTKMIVDFEEEYDFFLDEDSQEVESQLAVKEGASMALLFKERSANPQIL
ncbi:MAG: hypothetical protein ACTICQ_13035 [Glutamicibacter arilaitensis]|uniref:hypothetical protein n=1 Tax=Glutamicibacter arilaitensis TaxID=256701 RepID=UPI003FB811B7